VAHDATFHKVRWHVPASTLGVTLPSGYHLLEAPLQIFLYFGDQEIATFATGTDPKEIQRQAEAHAATAGTASAQTAADEDKITGLPWSASLRGEAARLASTADLHIIAVHLGGLDTLMDVYGYKAAHSVLRQISRRMKKVIDTRDRLARHCGDKLLIFTTRPLEDVRGLVDVIHQQVAAVGLETDGDRLPHSRLGIATVDRLGESDPIAVQALIDAVIISAEIASTGGEAPAAPIRMEPSAPQAAVPAAQERYTPVAAPPHEVSEPVPPRPPAREPAAFKNDEAQNASPVAEEEPAAPVYELPPEPEPLPASEPEPPIQEAPAPMPAAFAEAEQPSAAPPEETAPPAGAMPVPTPDGVGRIRFKGASLDVSGQVATATVKLMLGDREVVGRAVGRNAQERRLFLAAEAAARAVTEFLPPGYGVVVHDIQPAPPDVGKALWAAVLFLTPSAEESLLGIAPIDDMVFEAAGKAVLNAVNRRVGLLLGTVT
jgi:GGDEF domain-containing protein